MNCIHKSRFSTFDVENEKRTKFVLGGYTSAVALGIVALMMCIESLERFINPQSIGFSEAIFVAVVGLVVNVVSMFILHDHHDHHDHNIRAVYMHVLADAITSLLAMVALVVGKYVG